MSKHHTLAIKKINRETPSAVSLHFDIPAELKEIYQFEAGQHLTLETSINGQKTRRSYSLSSTPHSGFHEVVVKEVKGGVFSVFANQNLKENDVMDVFLPSGKFLLKTNASHSKNYVAIAAGSGITPIMSMVQSVLEKEPESTFLLVYGNKSPEETIFLKRLMDLQARYPERFFLELVFSTVQEEGAQFGRISTGIANYFLKNKYKDTNFDEYYLCGPELLIEELRTVLKDNGAAEENIHFELFTTTEAEIIPQNTQDGNTAITIMLDDETTTFVMSQTGTVLDAALEQDLDAPYSCQGGICSTCIARVKEGEVTMRKNLILTDSEIAEGLILTCQAQPITPILTVDYDDV